MSSSYIRMVFEWYLHCLLMLHCKKKCPLYLPVKTVSQELTDLSRSFTISGSLRMRKINLLVSIHSDCKPVGWSTESDELQTETLFQIELFHKKINPVCGVTPASLPKALLYLYAKSTERWWLFLSRQKIGKGTLFSSASWQITLDDDIFLLCKR